MPYNTIFRVKVLLRCIDMTVLPYKEGFPKKDFMIKVNGVYISVCIVVYYRIVYVFISVQDDCKAKLRGYDITSKLSFPVHPVQQVIDVCMYVCHMIASNFL